MSDLRTSTAPGTLRRVAAGLLELHRTVTRERAAYLPYPALLQQALDEISMRAMRSGTAAPSSVVDLLHWSEEQLGSWPTPLVPTESDLAGESLLWFGSPTATCEELGEVSRDFVADERETETITAVRDKARAGDPATYGAFRRFVIENPTVDVLQLQEARATRLLIPVADELQASYERPRAEWIVNGVLQACGRCGGVLRPVRGTPACTDSLCQGTARASASLEPRSTLVLRRDLQRYIGSPGRPEVRLHGRIKKLGVPTELWPDLDAYDLSAFANDLWAVDMKAWRHASLLGEHLVAHPPRLPVGAARMFIVIADEVATTGYVSEVRARQHGTARANVSIVSERVFLKRVKDRLKNGGVA